jgi:hypothetical protein
MDEFAVSYLWYAQEISLIPGPKSFVEPFYSTEMQELESYPAKDVLQTLSSLDNVVVVSSGGTHSIDEWYAWKLRWEKRDQLIEIGFTVFDEDDEYGHVCWGGSELVARCTFADLVRFWRSVQARHPAIWLHDDACRVYTPHSFLATHALPVLHPALRHADPVIRERAWRELATYHELGYVGSVGDAADSSG